MGGFALSICQRSMRPTGTSRARCGCSKSLPRRWRGHSSIPPGLARVLINGPLANERRRSAQGHEDAFPPPRLSGRCRFSQGTFAGTRGNGEDAPIPAVPRTDSESRGSPKPANRAVESRKPLGPYGNYSNEPAAIRAKAPKPLLLVDDRGVYGVLEQVGVDDRAVPAQLGRHAEIDPDHVLLRVCPDIGAAIADMPEARPGDESAVNAEPVTRCEDVQPVPVAAAS